MNEPIMPPWVFGSIIALVFAVFIYLCNRSK
jgi:hypothetical protein